MATVYIRLLTPLLSTFASQDYNYKVYIIYDLTQKAEHLLINSYKSTNITLTSLNVSSSASPYYECAVSHSRSLNHRYYPPFYAPFSFQRRIKGSASPDHNQPSSHVNILNSASPVTEPAGPLSDLLILIKLI